MEKIKKEFDKIISIFNFKSSIATTSTFTSITTTPSSTTFKVSNVNPNDYKNPNPNEEETKSSIFSQLNQYDNNHCTEVLMETKFSSSVQASSNGFINTVIECYNNHYNLIIRPDDIWTAILTQFSFYVNANAEEFRGQFVAFEGKKELTVTIDGMLRAAPYDLFVNLMTEQINENLVDDTVKDWVLPNFTTTTPDDIVTCGIILMATMKKYFNFSMRLCCGIPYVTLEGSVDDWENILNRLEKLKSYKLNKWYDMLVPILREFVAAKKNKPNINFWNRICHHSGRGSGPRYISGWLTAFAVFDEEGKWTNCGKRFRSFAGAKRDKGCDCDSSNEEAKRTDCNGKKWPKIDIADIPPGIVTVDVKIIDMNGAANAEYETVMFAGHVAYEVLEDECTLQPRIGCGLSLKLTAEEIEKIHQVARLNKQHFCDTCHVQLIDFETKYE